MAVGEAGWWRMCSWDVTKRYAGLKEKRMYGGNIAWGEIFQINFRKRLLIVSFYIMLGAFLIHFSRVLSYTLIVHRLIKGVYISTFLHPFIFLQYFFVFFL